MSSSQGKSGNAQIFHFTNRSSIRPGLLADLVAVARKSTQGIGVVR